jgi:hypothetical protein
VVGQPALNFRFDQIIVQFSRKTLIGRAVADKAGIETDRSE